VKLKMMIGNRLVAVADIDPRRIKTDGYVLSLQETLVKKHAALLAQVQRRPTFFIEVAAGNSYDG